ncbi:MAG: hypothetical protein U5K27_03925 [Desulfotignum sp.]|nr:hypothetical protein [Desulfotignum sp.]
MDSKNQYCPTDVTSKIQWRVFLATVLKLCGNISGLVDLNMLWSQWSKAFNKHFPNIISETAEKYEIKLGQAKLKYRCPRGKTSLLLMDYMPGNFGRQETSGIRITTIHQSKGETHDATLLVSSPAKRGSKGGHWSELRLM